MRFTCVDSKLSRSGIAQEPKEKESANNRLPFAKKKKKNLLEGGKPRLESKPRLHAGCSVSAAGNLDGYIGSNPLPPPCYIPLASAIRWHYADHSGFSTRFCFLSPPATRRDYGCFRLGARLSMDRTRPWGYFLSWRLRTVLPKKQKNKKKKRSPAATPRRTPRAQDATS